ncbi:MAG: hypothetical protein NTX03_13680, partial [Bacteroidetes bacterium]|nr:hypothetical protein [Bacteroidota bacterium]
MKKQTLILAGFILLTAINVSVFIINGSIKAPESSTTPLTQGTPVKTVSLTTSPSLIDLATARAATEMFWNED